MKQVFYRTPSLRQEDVKRDWHLVDVKDQILGKQAVVIAKLLMGKHKVGFTNHTDNGDFVVVINAAQVAVTGNKEQDKMYYRHSGHPGNLKEENLAHLRSRQPEQIIIQAVKNMLPKNRTQAKRMARLKVFALDQHPYGGQISTTNQQETTK
ncbi:50S ribosomal protein L13 [Microgenomates group bacterium]|nr:50S ribosomal protein L13 [Microgenomates group bacterium]